MSIALLFCTLAVVIQLVLGLLVVVKDFRKSANLVFSLLLFLFTLWSLAEIMMILKGVDAFSIKLLMTPGILLGYFFCIFSAIYPENQASARINQSRFNQLLFFVPAASLLWLLWSNQLVQGFSPIENGFTISFGRFEFLAKGIIVGYLLYSLSTLSNSRKNAETKIQMRRLRYTFTAMLLPIAAGSIVIAAGKFFIGGQTAYTFGLFPLLGIVMSTLLAYTMLKYNLMEIDLMFSIGLVYTLLTAILAGCMELMQELMQDLLSISDFWTKLISVLVIAAIFSPLKDLLIRLVDHFFGRRSFDSASTMQHILGEMRRCQKIDRMMMRMAQELKLVLDFSFCHVCLNNQTPITLADENAALIPCDFSNVPEEINEIEAAIEYFRSIDRPGNSQQMLKIKESGIRHFFRLKEAQNDHGLLLLGGKATRVPYTETEINLVTGICHEVPFIIENLRMIERLISQDRNLQEIEWAKKMLQAISVPQVQLQLGNFSFAHFSSLSSEIKGDLIDFCQEDGQSFIGLYDAFHHGIKAVLTLNLVFSVFRAENKAEKKLGTANKVLQNFHEEKLCSAATLIEAEDDSLKIFSAGNPAPVVFSESSIRELEAGSTSPLGLSGQATFCSHAVQLAAQEFMLISTNGLFKAFAEINCSLNDFLKEKFASPQDCRDKIVARLSKLLSSGFSDDITFLIAGCNHETTNK